MNEYYTKYPLKGFGEIDLAPGWKVNTEKENDETPSISFRTSLGFSKGDIKLILLIEIDYYDYEDEKVTDYPTGFSTYLVFKSKTSSKRRDSVLIGYSHIMKVVPDILDKELRDWM